MSRKGLMKQVRGVEVVGSLFSFAVRRVVFDTVEFDVAVEEGRFFRALWQMSAPGIPFPRLLKG